MLAHGVKIKQLLIGIDEFSFRVDPKEHLQQPMRQPYIENKVKFYANYLVRMPDPRIIKSSLLDPPSAYDIYVTGRHIHPEVDERIESNIEKHVSDPKFNKPVGYRGNRTNETLKELKAIQDLAKQNNIKLTFFINPLHKTTYLDTNLQEFNEFKQRLALISSYYDFSGINTITSNNYYYYETSHYRPIVGDMMIARLYNTGVSVPEDFGVMVQQADTN